MSRKIRIASTLALIAVLAATLPAMAAAGGPLLGGYGGPGAGEQVLLGSTLLKGSSGRAGPRGPTGSVSSVRGGSRGAPSGARDGSTSAGETGARNGSKGDVSVSRGDAGTGKSSQGTRAPVSVADPRAFVYPSSVSSVSADSPALGLSGGDLALLIGMIAALALVAVLTTRLARLQRYSPPTDS